MCSDATPIAPDTTIADLLRRFPHLDEPLACLVPFYRELPAGVRTAIGDTTTLQELAASAGVPLGGLVTALREAAGVRDAADANGVPGWASGASKTVTFDARPMLASGGHPVGDVMAALAALGAGEVYVLVTPFVPSPLVDMARARGFDASTIWEGDNVKTFFRGRLGPEPRG